MKGVSCFIFVLMACLLPSCKNKTSDARIHDRDIKYLSINNIEKVIVDTISDVSFWGFSGVCEDSLYFFDRALSYYYKISTEGKVGSRSLGLGHGPGEVPVKSLLNVSYSDKLKALVMMGGSYDAYLFDTAKQVKEVRLKADHDRKSYKSSGAYTIWDELIMRSDGSHFYYNIIGNNEDVDIMRQDYFTEAAIIMKVNTDNGDMSPIGRYSDFYVQNAKSLRHLPHIYFDVDGEGGFFVTYQVDTLIYHYDKNFKLLYSFGFSGKDMDTDYSVSGVDMESVLKAYDKDIERVGFYYWLDYIEGYVFRSYRKSGKSLSDGLQIYKDGILVGDVDVPKDFCVMGYIKPYFITRIISDEDKGEMFFYKFEI